MSLSLHTTPARRDATNSNPRGVNEVAVSRWVCDVICTQDKSIHRNLDSHLNFKRSEIAKEDDLNEMSRDNSQE